MILKKEGVIQRFKYSFELAWKTLNDHLAYQGAHLQPVTPRSVIKQAFLAGVIEDGQAWIDMQEHRNVMSHAYDQHSFLKALEAIQNRYLDTLRRSYAQMKDLVGK